MGVHLAQKNWPPGLNWETKVPKGPVKHPPSAISIELKSRLGNTPASPEIAPHGATLLKRDNARANSNKGDMRPSSVAVYNAVCGGGSGAARNRGARNGGAGADAAAAVGGDAQPGQQMQPLWGGDLALRGETRGSKIRGEVGTKWDSRDGPHGHQAAVSGYDLPR